MNIENSSTEISFNKDFCLHLEYHIGGTLEKSGREDLKGFWCDGVLHSPIPESQLTRKSVNDNRKIITPAWIGKDGQGEYEMTILFGKYSLRRYAKGTSMIDCVPSNESMDWIDIDVDNRKIEIILK